MSWRQTTFSTSGTRPASAAASARRRSPRGRRIRPLRPRPPPAGAAVGVRAPRPPGTLASSLAATDDRTMGADPWVDTSVGPRPTTEPYSRSSLSGGNSSETLSRDRSYADEKCRRTDERLAFRRDSHAPHRSSSARGPSRLVAPADRSLNDPVDPIAPRRVSGGGFQDGTTALAARRVSGSTVRCARSGKADPCRPAGMRRRSWPRQRSPP